MRKAIISVFILLLLLLILWGLGAWHLGGKTEKSLKTFIDNEQKNTDSLFNYELLDYERSIFAAKASIKFQLNENNILSQFIDDFYAIDNNQSIKVDILHGPVLLDRSGIRAGSSAWKIHLPTPLTTRNSLDSPKQITLNQLPKAYIEFSLENTIDYKAPLKLGSLELFFEGNYNPISALHQGKLISNELSYQTPKQNIKASQLSLNYQQLVTKSNNNLKFEFAGLIPDLKYTHNLLAEKLVSQVNYSGSMSLENNILSSSNEFLFNAETAIKNNSKSNVNPTFPMETGNFNFNINNLNVDDFYLLIAKLSQLQNSQQQIAWILETQAEFPEGQEQIWQLQDNVAQDLKPLPHLLEQLLMNKREPNTQSVSNQYDKDNTNIRFSFNTKYQNKSSSLMGAIYPDITDKTEYDLFSSQNSLFSVIQARANVRLENEWLRFISNYLPIKKENFKLTYKQNKLLMQ